MNVRSKKWLNMARGQDCKMLIPGVCSGDPAETISAHSNLARHGHGRGIKAHDCFTADACANCHAWLDHGRASREDKERAFMAAFERTLLARFSAFYQIIDKKKSEKITVSKVLPRR